MAAMERASLNEVEKGLAHAQVSDDPPARAASDQTALELATAKHERVTAPLCDHLATLDRHSATEREELQVSTTALEEMTRTHREREARVASFEAQKRSTAAALEKAERIRASFLAGFSAQQPAPTLSAIYAAPAAQKPRTRTHRTTSVASAARQPPASATLTTLFAPPRSTAYGSGRRRGSHCCRRGATARFHRSRPTGPLVPPVTLAARPTMPPPASREPHDPSTSAPWSVVVSRPNRHQQLPPPTPRNARYLELMVSKLMFRNKLFPLNLRATIKDHASEVPSTLFALTRQRYRLYEELDLATQDRTPLSDRVVNATLRLRDLLDAACDTTHGGQWLRDTLRKIEMDRANRTESSARDSSTTTGQRRREEPSSGRGNSKRATFSGSDSDSGPHPRRTERDRRQVPPIIFHAAELNSDTPSFPPRIFRPRATQRPPSRSPISSTVNASDADPLPSLNQMVAAVTAAAIAAVDRRLAHMGLCPAPIVPHTGSVVPTTHPTVIPPNTVPAFARTAPVAQYTGIGAPTTYPAAISPDTIPSFMRSSSVAPPPASVGTVNPYLYPYVAPAPVSTLPPADPVASITRPAPVPTRTPPTHATSLAPVLNGPSTPAPPDERILNDDSSSLTSNSSSPFGLRADFVASLQAAYRTLDMRRVPRVQPLQFPHCADRTAATQLLIRSRRDALSGIFDVADPTVTVTLTSPVWVHRWHVPLLKLTKAAISPNRDDTHDLHRFVEDLFSQLQERLTSGSSGPDAFRTLLADFADYFDRAPRGAALATLQNFGVHTRTPFVSYLRALRVVVASTVEKGGPLAPSAAMAIELVKIRTAQQYPMEMPTLFPGDLATRKKNLCYSSFDADRFR